MSQPLSLPEDFDDLASCLPANAVGPGTGVETAAPEITCSVREEAGDDPIKGAEIYFTGASRDNLSVSGVLRTDAQGSAMVGEVLPAGLYRVWVKVPGRPIAKIGLKSDYELRSGQCLCLVPFGGQKP